MEVDSKYDGRIYAAGSGGVVIFSPQGKELGFISTEGQFITNVVASPTHLYMTGGTFVAHLPLTVTRSCSEST